jgi:integrase
MNSGTNAIKSESPLPVRNRFGKRAARVRSSREPAPEQFVRRRREARRVPVYALAPLINEFSVTFGTGWGPVTRRKHADDFERFLVWLEPNEIPATTEALEFMVLARYVDYLRHRPRVHGVWRGSPGALARSVSAAPVQTLSANSVNAYVRPLRSFAIWLVDEGLLAVNPFRRSRRRASLNPLLPTEETPTKSATLEDLRALERGCAGSQPLDLRDASIASILVTTAARNSSVRLLRVDDVDFEREVIRFRRAKGGKTLEVALQPGTAATLRAYLERGRVALPRASLDPDADPGWLFLSHVSGPLAPLSMNALSLMLTRRYHAGGGSLPYFGSHRIRHATATLLVNNGMPLEEVSRYLGHSSTAPTRRYARQTPEALGVRAADALARAGLIRG